MLLTRAGSAQWFKYVTPETWENNDLTPETLSRDLLKGKQASQEIEAAPLPIKIRYLCEFWAADVTPGFEKLQVPVLALIPGFDETFLANPANGFAKVLNTWLTVIPTHRSSELCSFRMRTAFVFDDQPQLR